MWIDCNRGFDLLDIQFRLRLNTPTRLNMESYLNAVGKSCGMSPQLKQNVFVRIENNVDKG